MERVRDARKFYALLAWGVVVALLVQVSLIGLWLFSGQPTLAIHKEFGHLIFLGVFAMLILALIGRLPSPLQWWTGVLSVVTAIQTEVFALLPGSPLRAFHTVLPLVIFLLAGYLAYAALPLAREHPQGTILPGHVVESRSG